MSIRKQTRRIRLWGIRGLLGVTAVLVGLTAGTVVESGGGTTSDIYHWNNTGSEAPPRPLM
ncbi:hypothetical protein GCM10010441_43580 [Kitasatospora paracochleata]|uniref:Uncharacterized protein n=1 Tax=Kitasatospora paracochleata TaxID=58354 RepID=A0ABT1IT31_9ACTN|nr:hypothetical protein [Kitasatospora paracochleata]MCP2308239.1 hypothetical protein [Kitasatospora paracochleata]